MHQSDWADREADELLTILLMTNSGQNRREVIAAKFRELESRGALRGAQQIAGGVSKAFAR